MFALQSFREKTISFNSICLSGIISKNRLSNKVLFFKEIKTIFYFAFPNIVEPKIINFSVLKPINIFFECKSRFY